MAAVIMFIIGLGLFIYGLASLSVPVAMIVGGLTIMVVSANINTDGGAKNE